MNPLGSIGAHPTYTQEQIAGVRTADGSFMSSDSAKYLNERFQTIAAIISPWCFSSKRQNFDLASAQAAIPIKPLGDLPVH